MIHILVNQPDKTYIESLKTHPRQATAEVIAMLVGEYKQSHPETTVNFKEEVIDSGSQEESQKEQA